MICYAGVHDHLPDLLRLIAVGYIAWPRNAAVCLLPRNRGNDDVKEQAGIKFSITGSNSFAGFRRVILSTNSLRNPCLGKPVLFKRWMRLSRSRPRTPATKHTCSLYPPSYSSGLHSPSAITTTTKGACCTQHLQFARFTSIQSKSEPVSSSTPFRS